MNSWLQIAKVCDIPGKMPITRETLDEMASSYDPAKHHAPLVLGHPDTDTLWAKIEKVTGEARRMVREGQFQHVSMAVYPEFEATGGTYLRHVGLLGAAPPAMKGMVPVKFADKEGAKIERYDDLTLPIGDPAISLRQVDRRTHQRTQLFQ